MTMCSFRPIKRGVRQGCLLSSDLFNLYSEYILRDFEELKRASIGGQNVTNLAYADDTMIIAESEKDLQIILDKVVSSSKKIGLELNI